MYTAFTASASAPARIHLYRPSDWKEAGSELDPRLAAQAKAQRFTGGSGDLVILAGDDGSVSDVLFGLGESVDALATAALSAKLPEGDYVIERDAGLSLAHPPLKMV